MDREEARELLLGYSRFINEETDLWEALDLAIEAAIEEIKTAATITGWNKFASQEEIVDDVERQLRRLFVGAIESLPPVTPTERTGWILVSERLPKDLEEVVVTWVNRNPPVYYRHEKDKPQTGFAVLYRDTWHWWDSTIVDVLAEYGSRCEIEHISEDIEILAWQPLPEPYESEGEE